MKKFFGYSKYHSVTEMLLALGLYAFDTVIHNTESPFCMSGVGLSIVTIW